MSKNSIKQTVKTVSEWRESLKPKTNKKGYKNKRKLRFDFYLGKYSKNTFHSIVNKIGSKHGKLL